MPPKKNFKRPARGRKVTSKITKVVGTGNGIVSPQGPVVPRPEDLLQPGLSGKPSLGDLLKTLPKKMGDASQRRVAEIVGQSRIDLQKLPEQLKAAGLGQSEAVAVERTLRLSDLTRQHLPLMQELQKKIADDQDPSLKALTRLRRDQWIDLAYGVGAPLGSGLTPEAYAQKLGMAVEDLHPTSALASRLDGNELKIAQPGFEKVGTFLGAHPDFDITRANIPLYVKQAGGDQNQMTSALLKLQRLKKISATWEETGALINTGFESALDVARMGRQRFVARMAGQMDPDRAAVVHENAMKTQAVSLALMTSLMPRFSPQPAAAMGKAVPMAGTVDMKQYPTLATLFGSLDTCACNHDQSVLSPAAYMVDLLDMLRDCRNHNSALSCLIKRRPDLVDLQLSLANTTTELPYLDLVLEIFENAVAFPQIILLPQGTDVNAALTASPLSGEIIKVLQTTAVDPVGQGLTVVKDQAGTTDSYQAWTIADDKRRWTVYSQAEGLTLMIPATGWSSFVAQASITAAFKALLKELDQKHLSADSKNLLKGLMPSQGLGDDYFTLVAQDKDIAVLAAGFAWSAVAQLALKVTIAIKEQVGTLTLSTPEGTQLYQGKYRAGSLIATSAGFQQGKIAGALAGLISPAGDYVITALEASSWTVARPSQTLALTYVPDLLCLGSLTYQTVGGAQDLQAVSENQNPRSYRFLRTAVFPWTLPFHQPLQTVRAVLARAGVTRRQLIEAVNPGHYWTEDVWAREMLGLSPEQAELITRAAAAPDLWDRWGAKPDKNGQTSIFDADAGKQAVDTPLALLATESILMQQARLTYTELQAVLATGFVNASSLAIKLAEPSAGMCCPRNFILVGLSEDHLDRIHRFVRLWRKLQWKAGELDLAIRALTPKLRAQIIRPQFPRMIGLEADDQLSLGGKLQPGGEVPGGKVQPGGMLGVLPDLTPQVVQGLAHLLRLQELLDSPILDLALWWGGTLLYWPTALPGEPQPPSLYEQLFQNPRTQNPVDPDLALNESRTDLAKANLKISGKLNIIAAGLGIRQDDLQVLLAQSGVADSLTLPNLFELYRLAGLIRGLGLKPADFFRAKALSGIGPFDSTADMVAFCEIVRFIQASGFTLDELGYLLQHDLANTAELPFMLTEAQASQHLDTLRLGLRAKLQTLNPQIELWLKTEHPDLLALDPLDPARQTAVVSHADFRGQLADAAASLAAKAFDFGLIAAKKLLLTDPNGYGNAVLRHPADDGQDAVMALVSPDFMSLTGTNTPAAHDLVFRLQKISLLFSKGKLRPAELFWMADPAKDLKVLDFNQVPVAAPAQVADLFLGWQRLAALFKIKNQSAAWSALMEQYVSALHAQPQVEALLQVLAQALDLPRGWDLKSAAAGLGLTTWDDSRDPLKLRDLMGLLVELKKLGADPGQASTLASDWPLQPDPAPDAGAQAAQLARALLQAKYGTAAWREIIRPVSDSLRTQQRDALADFLVCWKALKDVNALYEYYLIDSQMTPCMLTSRLVQAIAAVQQFVQRCLLNLEKDVDPAWIDHDRWGWMKNYRVWEANRKVFLYPENWLYPELRDDKTEIFRQLESGLAQGEPTFALGRENLLQYLDALAQTAKMKVFGLFEDADSSGISTLYVVGRLPDEPYKYYWRKCTRFGLGQMSWTGWERIDLDITDDHIIPFVLDGNFHIAWPTITQTGNDAAPEDKTKYWQIKLNCARYTTKGWTDKKVSKTTLPELGSGVRFPIQWNAPMSEILLEFANQADGVNIAAYYYQFPQQVPNLYPTLPQWQNSIYEGVPILSDGTAGYEALRFGLEQWGSNFWANAEFELHLFFCYRNENNAILGYRAAGGQEVAITVYYANGLDDLAQQNITTFTDSLSSNTALYRYTLDWSTFEPVHDVGPTKYVTKIELSVKVNGVRMVAATYRPVTPDSVLGNYYKPSFTAYHNIDVQVQTQPALQAMGEFHISALNDLAIIPQTDNLLVPVRQLLIEARQSQEMDEQREKGGITAWKVKYFANVYRQQAYFYGKLIAEDFILIHDTLDSTAGLRPQAYQSLDALFGLPAQETIRTLTYEYPASSTWLPQWAWLRNLPQTSMDIRCPAAPYNWEIFYHAPLLIAEFLTRQQRFEDAQQWLHFIFDPTHPVKDAQTSEAASFWRFLPFRQAARGDSLQQWFAALAKAQANPQDTTVDPSILSSIAGQIDQWSQNTFVPSAVARLRPVAYQWRTLFAYLNNLIAWGDQRFRRFTRESVNEALQLYVLAFQILGPRPKTIPPLLQHRDLSYRDLCMRWDEFSNAWLGVADLLDNPWVADQIKQLNDLIAQADWNNPHYLDKLNAACQALNSVGMLYFCVPANDKLQEYWDVVEDRLFKIRHCMDLDGRKRELALFAPPIDPELLVRATAAGLDIDTVLADLDAPLAPYRFQVLAQKANEICAEVKSLGASLLSALEKKDAEAMARLRSTQEIDMLQRIADIKQRQIDEANANLDALVQNRAVVLERFNQFQKLLGKPAAALDASGLPVLEASSALVVAANAPGDEAGLGLIQYEVDQLASLESAHGHTESAGIASMVSGILHALPNFSVGVAFVSQMGGTNLGSAAGAIASYLNMQASNDSYEANRKGMLASYQRRQDEWVRQSKLALEEIRQINKQIIATQIRQAMAVKERVNQEKQIANAQALDDFLRDKFTNQELFEWMSGEVSQVFFQSYQLAYGLAKQTEKAFRQELGLADSNYIQFAYWNSLKKGLLTGEKLALDLKRMEIAYLEQNERLLEITKHVSLALLAPGQLLALKQKGECTIELPEILFDLDYPGHYLRRLKSVSLTIPCVVGPYTSVNCTLTLQEHHVRLKPTLKNGQYVRDRENEDNRFQDSQGPVQSIATSTSQNDSGLFEVNFHDDRYLPFESAGAISTWKLQMDPACNAFDMNTISDVVLHLKYTAKDAGDSLKTPAQAAATPADGATLISAYHRFSGEWHRALNPDNNPDTQILAFNLESADYPFLLRGKSIQLTRVEIRFQPQPGENLDDIQGLALKLTLEQGRQKLTLPDLTLQQDPNYPGLVFGEAGDEKARFFTFDLGPAAPDMTWSLSLAASPGADQSTYQYPLTAVNVRDCIILFKYTVL